VCLNSYPWICGGVAEELASGKDAKEKEWLADVSIQGLGPFQAAARLGRVDVCRCMVEELGFDINAGSKIGKFGLKIDPIYVLMSSILQCYYLHNLSLYVNPGKFISVLYTSKLCSVLSSDFCTHSLSRLWIVD
jgi:hypothetical protein